MIGARCDTSKRATANKRKRLIVHKDSDVTVMSDTCAPLVTVDIQDEVEPTRYHRKNAVDQTSARGKRSPEHFAAINQKIVLRKNRLVEYSVRIVANWHKKDIQYT
jgi:hypothetical protein